MRSTNLSGPPSRAGLQRAAQPPNCHGSNRGCNSRPRCVFARSALAVRRAVTSLCLPRADQSNSISCSKAKNPASTNGRVARRHCASSRSVLLRTRMGPLLSLLKNEVADKAFFADLSHALLLGGDIRVEGAARVAADREHVHHVLLLALHPLLSDADGWGREFWERRAAPDAPFPGAPPLAGQPGPGSRPPDAA